MSKAETIQLMAMLGAFYGAGKANPEIMAEGWFLILEPYDFPIAQKAVLTFAKNDTRDYATFPAVGKIVQCIEEEMRKEQAPVKEVVRAISYGWGYDQLSGDAKNIIGKERYDSWLKMDAEVFASKTEIFADILKRSQANLLMGVKE